MAAFHTVRLTFIRHRRIARSEPIDQLLICREAITVVAVGVGCVVDTRVEGGLVTPGHDRPADEGLGGAIDRRYDVDTGFVCVTQGYTSSSSTVSPWAGVGTVVGSLSAAAFTPFITV
jgi:hypothetical protein